MVFRFILRISTHLLISVDIERIVGPYIRRHDHQRNHKFIQDRTVHLLPRASTQSHIENWLPTKRRQALPVAIVALVATIFSIAYVVSDLGINTSTTDMISADVPFRVNSAAFSAAFPQLSDNIVAVIDADTQEAAQNGALRLAESLTAQPEFFDQATVPGGERFFRENGLLFLDTAELDTLADLLAEAEPLLSTLSADPTLRGLGGILGLALGAQDGGGTGLVGLLDEMTRVRCRAASGPAIGSIMAAPFHRSPAIDLKNRESPARQFVIVRPVLDYGSLAPAAAAISALRATAAALDIDPAHGSRIRVTGSAAIDQEELESVKIGGQTAGYLSIALVTILLVMALKSLRLVVATVATLLMGLIWTAAIATFMVGELNLISVAFAVLFIGLGVDFGIHFALRYLEARNAGAESPTALATAGGDVGGALALSAVCAATGFFAFLPTDYRGLAELGLIAGIGMFVALLANLTVLPALIALMPPKPATRSGNHYANSITRFLTRRSRLILAFAAFATLGAFALIPAMTFDFNPVNLKDPRAESVSTFMDLTRDPDNSVYGIDLLVADPGDIEPISTSLEAVREIGQIISIESFVPTDQDDKLDRIDVLAFLLTSIFAPGANADPAEGQDYQQIMAALRTGLADRAATPDALGAAAAELAGALDDLAGADRALSDAEIGALEDRLTVHLPGLFEQLDEALYAAPITRDSLPAEITDQWIAADGAARILIQPATGISTNEELEIFADAVRAVAPAATGTPIIVTEAGRVILKAFLTATVIAFLTITAILFVILRRPRDVALILIPLLFAGSLTIAVSVIFGLTFNFANIIVLPLLLGLGISSAIHLVSRWRRTGDDLGVGSSSTPRAVFFSAMTTIAAFGSLSISGHLGMQSMGLLLAIALASTLIATLVVLPSLVAMLGKPKARKPAPMKLLVTGEVRALSVPRWRDT